MEHLTSPPPFDFILNNIWLLFATFLVFLMNVGFICLEAGMVRSKNVINVLFKTTLIPVIGLMVFSAWGFNLMFPGAFFQGQLIGFGGWGLPVASPGSQHHSYTLFLFQTMFASTAASIISAAVAERIKLLSFYLFIILFIGGIYPLVGMWTWGGGWLATGISVHFHDFAGSSVIHSSGGYAALIGAAMLGPRAGKYFENKIVPIPGHNMSLAVIGLFMIILGWLGFNGGHIPANNPELLSFILIITLLAGASGCIGAFFTSYFINGTHDITMIINGILAGLVSITAGADVMSVPESCVIGFIAGVLVVFSVLIFDKLKIDDPVGAISVHLICGTWGTIAIGLFGSLATQNGVAQLKAQLIGCGSIGLFVSSSSYVVLLLLKKTIGLRISARKESEGLDITEHGMKAYAFDIDK